MTSKHQPRYKKGDRIGGRYLVHDVKMGGMGEVYLCLDEELIYPFALKTFQGSSPDLADIFRKEVVSWIALEKHPNIVRLFYLDILDNLPFMRLEWVIGDKRKGNSLRSWLKNNDLDLTLALRFIIDIVRGLQHANAKVPGFVHRDLKPENILVNQSRQAKITDFGLATVIQRANLSPEPMEEDVNALGRSTHVGNIVGTPFYMPPEQWRGEADIDFRADIYSVGCIFYELLTGECPYTGRTVSELRMKHMEAALPPLDDGVPMDIKCILDGCLAKHRKNRYEQLDLLFDDFKRAYEAYSGDRLPELNLEEFAAPDYANRGEIFDQLGQHERAIADYDEALRLDSTIASVYLNRGCSYGDLGQDERAIDDFDQAIQLDPTDALAYYGRGVSHQRTGYIERAIADYDQAIQLDPTLAKAYNNRGNSYTALGQIERAIADYDQVIQLDPTDAPAYMNRGNKYASLGNYERAIVDFNRAIQLDPTFKKTYLSRGSVYAKLRKIELAIADFDQAIQLDPTDAEVYKRRGNRYADLRQHERAIADFDRAIQLDPTDAQANFGRGLSYGELDLHERAIADFDQTIQLDPSNAQAYCCRGISYANLEQHERAIIDFDISLRLDPNNPFVYYKRGYSYGLLGRNNRAIADFDMVVKLDPTNAQAYYYRGLSYHELKQHERAIADFDRAIQCNTTFTKAYYSRGSLYADLGQYERAIADYDTTIQLDSTLTYVTVYFDKGVALYKTGYLRESLPLFEKAYALGLDQIVDVIQRVRQELGLPLMQVQANPDDPQTAFDAFQQVASLEAMRQTVGQFPILRQMIPTIEQVIQQQVPPEQKPAFKQRLAWLRQIVEGK